MPKLTADQLAERRTGIGSSDVAALLGMSPYQGATAWGVFNEKRGLAEPINEESDQQRRGHDLEPLLAKWYKDEMASQGELVRLIPGTVTVRHPTEPWALATIDYRLEGVRRNLELKNVGVAMMGDWDRMRDDGIPDYVRTQVAWQMWVKDDEETHVGAFLGGTHFAIWQVQRDRELERLMVGKMRAAWQHILADEPPVIDDSEECRAYLDQRYPRPAVAIPRAATPAEEDLAIKRHAAAQLARSSEAERKRLDNLLIVALGDTHQVIVGADGWKAQRKPGKGDVVRYRFTPAKTWPGADKGDPNGDHEKA